MKNLIAAIILTLAPPHVDTVKNEYWTAYRIEDEKRAYPRIEDWRIVQRPICGVTSSSLCTINWRIEREKKEFDGLFAIIAPDSMLSDKYVEIECPPEVRGRCFIMPKGTLAESKLKAGEK